MGRTLPAPHHLAIVILTGSGVSAESGISTFRDQGGIWSLYDWREVATIDGYRRNPEKVLDFYNMRRRVHRDVAPNAAHYALARLEALHPGPFRLVTQNVDPLHERAGSRQLIHIHGEALKAFCTACSCTVGWQDDLTLATPCPNCGITGTMRPEIVWFGETPYHLDAVAQVLDRCHLFLSIGTSGTVYPAAGFAERARSAGAICIELNLEPSEGITNFHAALHGPATEIVPAFVDDLLSGAIHKLVEQIRG